MAFDEKAASKLEEAGEEVLQSLVEAAKSTKKVWVDIECKHCLRKQRHQADVPDAKAAIAAAEFLANRGFGRPAAKADDEEKAGVTFVRKIVYEGGGADD